MTQWARVLSNPDQPDDNTVIEVAEAEAIWDIVWTVPDIVTWLNVEVTERTGTPELNMRWDGEKFADV